MATVCTFVFAFCLSLVVQHQRARYLLVEVHDRGTPGEIITPDASGTGFRGKPGSGVKGPKGQGRCDFAHAPVTHVLKPLSETRKVKRAIVCPGQNQVWTLPGHKGNYIAYTLQTQGQPAFLNEYHTLELNDVWTKYCKPKPDTCTCTSLLSRVLEQNGDLDQIKGEFFAKPILHGCKCYLGAAANYGFQFIKLESEKEKCNTKKFFNNELVEGEYKPDNYREICAWYKKHKCFGSPGKITKA